MAEVILEIQRVEQLKACNIVNLTATISICFAYMDHDQAAQLVPSTGRGHKKGVQLCPARVVFPLRRPQEANMALPTAKPLSSIVKDEFDIVAYRIAPGILAVQSFNLWFVSRYVGTKKDGLSDFHIDEAEGVDFCWYVSKVCFNCLCRISL